MARTKKDNVPAKQNTSSVVAVPDYMAKYAGQGTENVGTKDIETPRLKLLAAISPEVQESDGVAGEFWHSIMECGLGKSVKIIPIYTDIRFILWRPRHESGGILARSDDGIHWSPSKGAFEVKPYKDVNKKVTWTLSPTVAGSGLAEWGSYDPENPDSPPAATKMYNVVVYLPEHPELSPCVVTLQRGSITIGRKFIGKLKMSQAPSYGMLFNMESFLDQNNIGDDFFNFKFTGDGFVDEDLFERCRAMYEYFATEGLRIKDIEGLQDEDRDESSASGGDEDNGGGRDF